jgi:ubiquinone/menaquinone biosynthesis C-methylase UbiE
MFNTRQPAIERRQRRTRAAAARRRALPCLAALAAAWLPLAPALADDGEVYEYRTPSRDGIGKIYMGREISHVMGHLGAAWLERPEREREERTDRLVRNLPLGPDSVVADIGAGTGYFSFRIAERVPQGKVIAVDIQPEMLDIVRQRMASDGVDNVEPRLGSERDPGLIPGSVDVVLLVDAYHEFAWPREMAAAMAAALKPEGRLVLVEYRAEDPSVPIKRLHKMSLKQARREMAAVGLELERNRRFLPQQHFMIFRRAATD